MLISDRAADFNVTRFEIEVRSTRDTSRSSEHKNPGPRQTAADAQGSLRHSSHPHAQHANVITSHLHRTHDSLSLHEALQHKPFLPSLAGSSSHKP